MFIVKLYTLQLLVFSGLYNINYAMVDKSEKQSQSVRSDRQFRPILNSLIFLLAANLVAKGAVGLNALQTPPLSPNHLQGSIYLTLNGAKPAAQQQAPIVPVWYPVAHQQVPFQPLATTTPAPRPITQTQIVNIHDPFVEEVSYPDEETYPNQQIIINRENYIDDFAVAASNEVKYVAKNCTENCENTAEDITTEPDDKFDDVEVFSTTEAAKSADSSEELGRQSVSEDEDEDEFPRQNPTTAPASTTTMPSMTTSPINTTNTNMTGMTNTTASNPTNIGYGYGPYTGNENINITTEPSNHTTNTTHNPIYGPPNQIYGPPNQAYGPPNQAYGPPNQVYGPPNQLYGTPTPVYGPPSTGYQYFPTGNYAPSKGQVNIAYGTPSYPKPFVPSNPDTFLNNYKPYGDFYNRPNYTPYFYNNKYNDLFKNYYNKIEYQYPSFYGNYVGK